MKDLILFSIDKNHFALELEKIKRIVQARQTTPVAGNAHEIEGIFTFEDSVLNVLDFRSMIGVESFASRYNEMFPKLKKIHHTWIEALVDTVDNKAPFTRETTPHDCPLGKWLASFQSYDDKITGIVDKLFIAHAHFHGKASGIIDEAQSSVSHAHEMISKSVEPLKEEIGTYLDDLLVEKELIANSMQKFLIIDADKSFAVRIDEVDDIIAISEEDIQSSENFEDDDSLIRIDGIFEYKEKLVNLISTITMPIVKG